MWSAEVADRPNVLLVVSDQERSRGWLPAGVDLPWRERLRREGTELTSHWTHSAPCSPSRSTLMTGTHLAQHGVVDNTIFPWHHSLDPAMPTIGSVLRGAGYRSSYLGKWHCTYGPHPDMDAYGYADWDGNDQHYMGWAGTGVHFDPVIAESAARWLEANAVPASGQPWFLTVALVNPHDVMWFPIDQPGYQAANPEELELVRALLSLSKWREDDDVLPAYRRDYERVVDVLPENFDDDLTSKPAVQRAWRHAQQHGMWGTIDPADTDSWLRHLDYYVELHRLADESLGTVLSALERSGAWDDTVVIFTSDHGDMAGSHGLRSKGPFVYDEIMRVPLYVRGPGIPAGVQTEALSSHVDVLRTIAGLAGCADAVPASVLGVDQSPVLRGEQASVRDHVLFQHETAHTTLVEAQRWAIRGFFDGRTKYARYYGIGGGLPNDRLTGERTEMLHGPDAAFEDQDHEWYDLADDPQELVNLAMDRSRKKAQREEYERLLDYERAAGLR